MQQRRREPTVAAERLPASRQRRREPTVAVVLAPGSRSPWRVPASVGREVACPLCSGRGDAILPDWMGGEATCPRCRGWGWVYWQGLGPDERADCDG
jgi:hypothetical protein